jgi:hypothetical protein
MPSLAGSTPLSWTRSAYLSRKMASKTFHQVSSSVAEPEKKMNSSRILFLAQITQQTLLKKKVVMRSTLLLIVFILLFLSELAQLLKTVFSDYVASIVSMLRISFFFSFSCHLFYFCILSATLNYLIKIWVNIKISFS